MAQQPTPRSKAGSTRRNSRTLGAKRMATRSPEYFTHQGYEVLETLDGDRMILSVGPHHPSTHGVLRSSWSSKARR